MRVCVGGEMVSGTGDNEELLSLVGEVELPSAGLAGDWRKSSVLTAGVTEPGLLFATPNTGAMSAENASSS